jgi:hypothetical protein
MDLRNTFGMALAVVVFGNTGTVWAYEGAGAIDPTSALCGNVQFTEFTPQ